MVTRLLPLVSSEPQEHYGSLIDELENVPVAELLRLIDTGNPTSRMESCEVHGPFRRNGRQFGTWTAWAGRQAMYSSGWSDDAGCPGCLADQMQSRSRWEQKHSGKSFPVNYLRTFELLTNAKCDDHGPFYLLAVINEYAKDYAEIMGKVAELNFELCPACEADGIYEMDVQRALEPFLSSDEWKRGGGLVLEAIERAKALTDVPAGERKRTGHPTFSDADSRTASPSLFPKWAGGVCEKSSTLCTVKESLI